MLQVLEVIDSSGVQPRLKSQAVSRLPELIARAESGRASEIPNLYNESTLPVYIRMYDVLVHNLI